MIVLNSVIPLPSTVIQGILVIDNLLLMMAMAALSLAQFATFKEAGLKSFILVFLIYLVNRAGIGLQLIFR